MSTQTSHGPRIAPGSVIIAYLHDPRERIWGMLVSLDVTGITVVGIELNSFDDWLRSTANDSTEAAISLSTAFYPLARVERVLLDEPGEGVPSMESRCLDRTGMRLKDHIERRGAHTAG